MLLPNQLYTNSWLLSLYRDIPERRTEHSCYKEAGQAGQILEEAESEEWHQLKNSQRKSDENCFF